MLTTAKARCLKVKSMHIFDLNGGSESLDGA